MNESYRLFDFLTHQLQHFPKADMFAGKENGKWITYSTNDVADTINRFSAGLLSLGLSGNDLTVGNQDKIAIISKNRPEWLMLDMACQQIGVILCPVYPTTNPHELEFIFNDASIKYVFISGQDILDKVNLIRDKTPFLKEVYSFDYLKGTIYWKDLLGTNTDAAQVLKEKISPTHCATIIYTSGTTGTPKGVM